MTLCTVVFGISLLCPFAESEEAEALNAVHELVTGSISVKEVLSSNFSKLLLLGCPLMVIQAMLPQLPTTAHLLIVRLLTSLSFAAAWYFLQRQIAYRFGSRVAFVNFCLTCVQFDFINGTFRLLPGASQTLGTSIALGFWLQGSTFSSLASATVALPFVGESLPNWFLSLAPLFVPRFGQAEGATPPIGVAFVYLSVLALMNALGSKANLGVDAFSSSFTSVQPLQLLSPFAIGPLMAFKHSGPFEVAVTLLASSLLSGDIFASSSFIFYALSASIGICQVYAWLKGFAKARRAAKYAALGLSALVLIFSMARFRVICNSFGGADAAFYLADLVREEAKTCDGSITAHVSKTVLPLGFSKMLAVSSPRVHYEFGTQYTESEFLQRFKYRAADINEHIDPAYWHTHSVHRGTERKKPLSLLWDWFRHPESHLQVKILVRKQADTVTADIAYPL